MIQNTPSLQRQILATKPSTALDRLRKRLQSKRNNDGQLSVRDSLTYLLITEELDRRVAN